MQALADTDVPVPRMLAWCDDQSVMGTPFDLMEFLAGRVFSDLALPNCSPGDQTRHLWRDEPSHRVRARVDVGAVALDTFGRPGNYVARQLSR